MRVSDVEFLHRAHSARERIESIPGFPPEIRPGVSPHRHACPRIARTGNAAPDTKTRQENSWRHGFPLCAVRLQPVALVDRRDHSDGNRSAFPAYPAVPQIGIPLVMVAQ